MIYSPSKLATFENCPLAFKFRYVDRLEVGEEGVEAFMGKRVHETLEKLYTDLQFSRWPEVEDLLQHYARAWEEKWHPGIRVLKEGCTMEDYFVLGKRCLSDYYSTHYPFNNSTTLAVERKFNVELEGYRLTGYMDRLSMAKEGHYLIHDYKTSLNLPSLEHLKKSFQLPLYCLAVKEMWGDAQRVEFIWHFLAFNKRVRLRKEDEFEAMKGEVVGKIAMVERALEENDFPPRESSLCPWCDYGERCPSRAHLIKSAGLSKSRFREEPGVKLVDRYASLVKEKRELLNRIEAQMEEVKEALVEYAEREGLEVVGGSEVKARIKSYPSWRYPGRGERTREELETLIKEAHLWEELSQLSYYSLSRALSSGKLEKGLEEKIKRYCREVREHRIYLSQR